MKTQPNSTTGAGCQASATTQGHYLNPSLKKDCTGGTGEGSGEVITRGQDEDRAAAAIAAGGSQAERDRSASLKTDSVRSALGLGKRSPLSLRPVKGARASTPKPLHVPRGGEDEFSQPAFEGRGELTRWEWEQEHKEIVAAVAGEQDAGLRLLTMCRRAAAKSARRLLHARGVHASDTSIQDAASDAVLAVLVKVPRFEHLTAKDWGNPRVLRALATYAARGAGRSLWSWSSLGMSGDNTRTKGEASAIEYSDWTDLATEALREAAGPDASQGEHERATRWRVVRWVYRVGFREFVRDLPASRGRSAAAAAARSRCRVVGNVIMGASLVDACAMAGFAGSNGTKNFAESCSKAGFWAALRAASLGDSQQMKQDRAEMRLYAVDCAYARRELDKLGAAPFALTAAEGRGRRVGTFGSDRARAKWQTDTAAAEKWRQGYQLYAEYVTAKETAIHYRDKVNRARAYQARAWDRVQNGLKSGKFGDLRQVAGLVDTHGRRLKRRPLAV